VPTAENKYIPHLLGSKAISIYLLTFIVVNSLFGLLFNITATAAVDASELYRMHNEERSKRGLSELSINTKLIDSATKKAKIMMDSNCWSHYCPDGELPWKLFEESGYIYVFAGENLAEGFDSNTKLMNAWLNSPTHRDNIVNSNFDEIGIGFAYGTFQNKKNNTIVVVHFGSQNNSPTLVDKTKNLDSENLKIISPENGAYINTNLPNLIGKAPNNSNVLIVHNGNDIGNIKASGTNFVYTPRVEFEDGNHKIDLVALSDQQDILAVSSTHTFTIDTIAPTISENSFTISGLKYNFRQTNILFQIEVLGDASQVLWDNRQFTMLENNKWEIEIDKNEIINLSESAILAKDKANNTNVLNLSKDHIQNMIEKYEINYSYLYEQNNNNGLFAYLQTLGSEGDIRTNINLIFLIFMCLLFVIDFYILSKSGLTGINRSKSHLHLPAFVALIIIIMVGANSSNILTGLIN
jgi:hypothetical protein